MTALNVLAETENRIMRIEMKILYENDTLTKEGPPGVRGISDRDLSQSIDHMGLVIWNFHRFSCRPFGVELQPSKCDFRHIIRIFAEF